MMDFEELRSMFQGVERGEWHRHENGGGWVEHTASVADSAYVGPDAVVREKAYVDNCASICNRAIVSGCARIEDDVLIEGNALVRDTALVRNSVVVKGRAKICDSAQVSGNAVISGYARLTEWCHVMGWENVEISHSAVIRGFAVIRGGKWKEAPFYIQGSAHTVQIARPGHIRIGCIEHPIKHWLLFYTSIGMARCYSEHRIAEYGKYIKLIAELHDMGVHKVVGYD
jgi:NDP-sugar pyrophosphorylase family protein